MRVRQTEAGAGSVEYLAVIAVAGMMFVGLTSLRPQRVSGDTPVDAVTPILRLLGKPLENLEPRPARPARPVAPRPRPPRPPRPRPPAPATDGSTLVPLPEWWNR